MAARIRDWVKELTGPDLLPGELTSTEAYPKRQYLVRQSSSLFELSRPFDEAWTRAGDKGVYFRVVLAQLKECSDAAPPETSLLWDAVRYVHRATQRLVTVVAAAPDFLAAARHELDAALSTSANPGTPMDSIPAAQETISALSELIEAVEAVQARAWDLTERALQIIEDYVNYFGGGDPIPSGGQHETSTTG
jgi:hypothetical protein